MSPFDVGQQFEDFVEKRIFNSSDYILVEKTHNYNQNNERFVESSLNPDFRFRPRNSSQEFYVEAKFRSGFNDEDKLKLLKYTQFQRFKSLNTKDHPVFLIVGVGGSPANPDILSLIPMADIKYLHPFKSVIMGHRIEKTGYNQNEILQRVPILFPDDDSNKIISQPINAVIAEYKFKSIYIGLGIIAMLLLILGYKSISNNPPTSSQYLKTRIESYYDVLEHNNTLFFDHYLNDKIDRWYNYSNVDIAFVKKDAEEYYQKYPIRDIKIEWPTYKESLLPNGDYSVSYYLIYKIKSNKQSAYKTYFLNIKAIWDKNFKLRSIYEDKLN